MKFIKELQQKLGLSELKVMNDFNAIAMSLPALSEQKLVLIGNGYSDSNKSKVVLGAGTGLGVAWNIGCCSLFKAMCGWPISCGTK